MSFTPTSEQLALREARRLEKQKAKAEARASSSRALAPLVNLEKGQIIQRSWLTVQDVHRSASRPVRIMTWNVRNRLLLFSSHMSCVTTWTCRPVNYLQD